MSDLLLCIIEELRQIYHGMEWDVGANQIRIIHNAPNRPMWHGGPDSMCILIEDTTLYCCGYGEWSLMDASELTDLFHNRFENIEIDLTDPQANIIAKIRKAIDIWDARQRQQIIDDNEENEPYFKYSHPNRIRKNPRKAARRTRTDSIGCD